MRLQVMCMSENKILTQCFDKEELSDKKRPETVRHLLLCVCVCMLLRWLVDELLISEPLTHS